MAKPANLAPTSSLPFAARHCDVPVIDLIRRFRSVEVEKLEAVVRDDDSPIVQFAWSMSGIGDRMSQIDDVLKIAISLFEKAHRGDSTESSPDMCFEKALRMLGLGHELLEAATLDGDEALACLSADMAAASKE